MDNPEKSATVSTYDTGRHGRDRMVVGFTTTYTCRPTRTHYPDSDAFSLMLHAWRRSNKYQFYSFWFDQIGARTYGLPQAISFTSM
jgi:hypothetical protein